MSTSLPQLDAVREVLGLPESKRRAGIEVVGPWGSGKALVAAQLVHELGASLLYITPGRIESESAFEDLSTFLGGDQCVLLPAWEVLPTDAMEPAVDIVAERMNGLKRMALARDRGVQQPRP